MASIKYFIFLNVILLTTSFQSASESNFELKISSNKIKYKSYRDIKIDARIVNKSGKDVYLIGNVDGALSSYRYPHIYFIFIDSKGDTLKSNFGACSNIDELQVKNFQLIKKDSVFDPFNNLIKFGYWGQSYFSAENDVKGKFKVQLIYSTNCTDKDKWKNWRNLKKPMVTVDSLINLVPKIELKSNWIDITLNVPGYDKR